MNIKNYHTMTIKIKNKPQVATRKAVAKRAPKQQEPRPKPQNEDVVGVLAGELHAFRRSILYFIKVMWGLVPQEAKPEYQEQWNAVLRSEGETWLRLKDQVKPEWFGTCIDHPNGYQIWSWHNFVKGEHVSWQQTLVLLGIEKAINSRTVSRHISVRSGHGIGKAHRPDDVIPTPHGLRKISDVQPGDCLFGEYGQPVKVLETKHWKNIPFYKVTFGDGSSVDVSSGHLWKVKNRNDRRTGANWQVISTEDIVKQGVLRPNGVSLAKQWEIPTQGSVHYNQVEVPVDAYTYGVWLGDGDKNSGRITNIDNEVWKNIAYKTNVVGKTRTAIGLQVDLRKHGLFGCSTYTAAVDRRYKYSQKRLEVLQGLLDTDGWVEKCGSAAFSSTSRQLTRDVIEIARSLGLRAREEKYKDNEHAGSWTTHITWDGVTTLFRIERKQKALINPEERYKKRWIASIEPVEKGDGICFSVDGEIYQCRDHIVTHNSATMSWVVLWFLYCFYQAQVPATAPTSGQMHDVLWKELSLWIARIKPDRAKEVFEWQHDYIRMKYDPETWFARAKTSTKENTEALAGVHSDHVLIAVDEASGVPEQVFNTAEGALTSGNVFVIMISNPTRTVGYFFDSHHKNADDWQTFEFTCEQTPLVDIRYVERQAKRHGVESDEYRIRVKGQFPSEDMMDDTGYLQLVPRSKVIVEPAIANVQLIGKKFLGIDPSGEGDDECEFVLRDQFRAYNPVTLNTTNDSEIAEHILTLADRYNLKTGDIVIEGFGKGATVAQKVAKATKGKLDLYVVLPGNTPKEEEKASGEFFQRFLAEVDDTQTDIYLNVRALMHFRMRDWIFGGGRILDNNTENSDWGEQIANVRYKRTLQGNKIQIMSKQEMNKLRIKSPNKNDALALTFLLDRNDPQENAHTAEERAAIAEEERVDDQFSVL